MFPSEGGEAHEEPELPYKGFLKPTLEDVDAATTLEMDRLGTLAVKSYVREYWGNEWEPRLVNLADIYPTQPSNYHFAKGAMPYIPLLEPIDTGNLRAVGKSQPLTDVYVMPYRFVTESSNLAIALANNSGHAHNPGASNFICWIGYGKFMRYLAACVNQVISV